MYLYHVGVEHVKHPMIISGPMEEFSVEHVNLISPPGP